MLAKNSENAVTKEQYAATSLHHIFDAVAPNCFANDLAIFQFFENTVKPKIVHDDKKTFISEYGASSSKYSHTERISVCDIKVSYSSLNGTSTSRITYNNSNGYSTTYTLLFYKK